MGAKYLDLEGLTRYDGKIKEKLGTKLYRHKLTIVGGIASNLTIFTTESRPYYITNATNKRLPTNNDILAAQITDYGTAAIIGIIESGSGTSRKMVINYVSFISTSPYISYLSATFAAGFTDEVSAV